MCGRYTQMFTWSELHELYELSSAPVELGPHYNVTPGVEIPAVRHVDSGIELANLHWGLIPAWAKDKKIAYKMSNARAETVSEKPAFRTAYRKRRCIIPASGFYEWQVQLQGPKQPFYIHPVTNEPWSFAGLWEEWKGPGDEVIQSCTVVTTEANSLMAPIHSRMPVIVEREQVNSWLDPNTQENELRELLSQYDSEKMRAYPVSTLVNKPVNDDSRCVEPVVISEASNVQGELF